jgi:hypothetical protein
MELLIGAGVICLMLLGLALSASSAGARRLGRDVHVLTSLARLRSPSGKRFFPSEAAAWDLSHELEGVSWPPADDAGRTGANRMVAWFARL